MESKKMKIVYVVTERNNKNYWNRVGVAFTNKDGSLSVRLEAIPVSGEMQIRDYVVRGELTDTAPVSQQLAA
ncbi:MAG: hypothetical protein HRU17_03525 [Polyangiaceae bacterium]|nr:hypothetical protein [Polyangiaceae bacterium]